MKQYQILSCNMPIQYLYTPHHIYAERQKIKEAPICLVKGRVIIIND
jgi:hypothetical protein